VREARSAILVDLVASVAANVREARSATYGLATDCGVTLVLILVLVNLVRVAFESDLVIVRRGQEKRCEQMSK